MAKVAEHFIQHGFVGEGGFGDEPEPKRLYEHTGLAPAMWRLIAADPAMPEQLRRIAQQIVDHEADFAGDDLTPKQKHALFWKLCENSGGHNANAFQQLARKEAEMAAVRDGNPDLPVHNVDIRGNERTTLAGLDVTLARAKLLIREARRRTTVWIRRS